MASGATTESKKTPTYTDVPACEVNIDALSATRFVDMADRKYPYRDVLGRVNLNLVNASLAEAEVDGASTATIERLAAWQRHAVRALARRPKDEQMTIAQLAESGFGLRGSPGGAGKGIEKESGAMEAGEVPKTVAMRRLFCAPVPADEPAFDLDSEDGEEDDEDERSSSPSADRLYRCQLAEESAGRRGRREAPRKRARATRGHPAPDSSASASDDSHQSAADDEYEVEAILEEDENGGRGFLIRWAGYGPEHDTWEPEWHLAPSLVESYRTQRALVRSHQHDDYMLGRKRMLWCATCAVHFSADSFSAQQRRVPADRRACLVHHYRTEVPMLAVSATTGVPVVAGRGGAAAPPVSPPRHRGGAAATPARPSSGTKRPRADDAGRSPMRAPPAPPVKAARPVARSLNNRQAAMEMRACRLFGFGAR